VVPKFVALTDAPLGPSIDVGNKVYEFSLGANVTWGNVVTRGKKFIFAGRQINPAGGSIFILDADSLTLVANNSFGWITDSDGTYAYSADSSGGGIIIRKHLMTTGQSITAVEYTGFAFDPGIVICDGGFIYHISATSPVNPSSITKLDSSLNPVSKVDNFATITSILIPMGDQFFVSGGKCYFADGGNLFIINLAAATYTQQAVSNGIILALTPDLSDATVCWGVGKSSTNHIGIFKLNIADLSLIAAYYNTTPPSGMIPNDCFIRDLGNGQLAAAYGAYVLIVNKSDGSAPYTLFLSYSGTTVIQPLDVIVNSVGNYVILGNNSTVVPNFTFNKVIAWVVNPTDGLVTCQGGSYRMTQSSTNPSTGAVSLAPAVPNVPAAGVTANIAESIQNLPYNVSETTYTLLEQDSPDMMFYDSIVSPMQDYLFHSPLMFTLLAPDAASRGIVKTSTGRIYVAYHTFKNAPTSTSTITVDYTDDNGVTFHNSLTLSSPFSVGIHSGWSLAIDSQDHLHLAYVFTGTGATHSVYYMSFNGSSWSVPTPVDLNVNMNQNHTDIKTDLGNNVSIAYNYVVPFQPVVAALSGGVWTKTTLVPGENGAFPFLAVDSLNRMHLTYSGYGGVLNAGNSYAGHMVCTSGVWGSPEVAIGLNDTGFILNGVPVVIDDSDEVEICIDFYDESPPDYNDLPKLLYARTLGGVWQPPEVVIDKSSLINTYTYGSISLDGNNPVIVAEIPLTDNMTDAEVDYFVKVGGVWTGTTLQSHLYGEFGGAISTLDKVPQIMPPPTPSTGRGVLLLLLDEENQP